MQKRNKTIDYMKGIAIILMVVGHSGIDANAKKLIYLFHMAIFFMISGYLFRPQYTHFLSDGSKFLRKKIMGLWLPCFLWSVFYTLLNNVFVYTNLYSRQQVIFRQYITNSHEILSYRAMLKNVLRAVAMSGRTEMGGAFWFLKTLFGVSLLFFVIDYFLQKVTRKELIKELIHCSIAGVFLFAGWLCSRLGINVMGIPVILSSYFLYLLGHIFQRYKIMKYINNIYCVLVAVFILVASLFYGWDISIGDNHYVHIWYLIVCSVSGWVICFFISERLAKNNLISFVEIIGQHTLAIVILHFLSFKIVSGAQILIYGYPSEYLAFFPTFNTNFFWWIPYSFVGVALPVCADILKDKAIGFFRNQIGKRAMLQK